jgi:nucleotide-binding universal stress UspA family protein
MYSNIIVGYDGSDEAEDALSLASTLRARDGVVTAVCLAGGHSEAGCEGALAALDERPERADWLRTLMIASDENPVHDLRRHLHESAADLLVLGSSCRGAPGTILTRSAGRALLSGCRCPVALAPRGFRTRAAAPRVVAVAFENEGEALHAVEQALRLTVSAETELRLLCLVPPLPPWALEAGSEAGYRPSDVERHHVRPYEHLLEDALEAIPAGVRVEAHMLEGPPAATLLRALQRGVDLVVLASPGARPIANVRPGATALAAIGRSPCPVLLTPTSLRPTGGERLASGQTR